MITCLFIEFLRHLATFKPPGHILLIFDGAKCHLDYTIVDEADRLDIKLFCLPSNCTHELPLDKAVYHSYEYHWNREVLRFCDIHPKLVITKISFNKIFSKVWGGLYTSSGNMISGFRSTGIFFFLSTLLLYLKKLLTPVF